MNTKKILAVVLLAVIAVVCVACTTTATSTGTTAAKAPETKEFKFTIINETGKGVNSIFLKDDNSDNKNEVKYEGDGLENGGKAEMSISAVPDKDVNPSLTISYTVGSTEYMTKIFTPTAEIRLTVESDNSGAFEATAPEK